MKPHESPPPESIKKSIRGDSWPVWNRGIRRHRLCFSLRQHFSDQWNFRYIVQPCQGDLLYILYILRGHKLSFPQKRSIYFSDNRFCFSKQYIP